MGTGSRLMLHTWFLEAVTMCRGAVSLKERPAPASEEQKASAWRAATHQKWLMAFPFAHQRLIEQWPYGSTGRKPTILRTLNAADCG